MIIGIDASRSNKEKKTGTEWYSYLLIEHLKKIIPANVTVRLYAREPLGREFAVLPANWEERVLKWPPKYLWTLVRLSLEMWLDPPDLLFVPAHGLPLTLPKRTVATIHDIGFERFPELYNRRALWYHRFVVRRALKRASAIITISEWSKKEIQSVFKNIPSPIFVTLLAHDERRYHDHIFLDDQREAQKRYKIESPYFLFIGRLEKKKNIVNIISAFWEFGKTDKQNYSLVLVGPRGYGFKEADQLIGKYKLDERVKILNWAPEADIPALMSSASALVFPSLYEGFGIPILEAMAVGTPVITSNQGATAEVAGNATLLVDSHDVTAISRAMQAIASDQNLRDKLRQGGFARAMNFSWEKTALATWEILHHL